MRLFSLKIASFVALVLVSSVSYAQNRALSEDEALKNFKEAAKYYRNLDEGALSEPKTTNETTANTKPEAVAVSAPVNDDIDQKEINAHVYKKKKEYAPIENVAVFLNAENKTLEEIVFGIVKGAKSEAGEWNVRWRVTPENSYILSERVNLTAETTLSHFMSYLVDRINNMTGIQLFVTVFDKSRIIVISDTSY